ncbi:Retrovirus-related Pol polyprotein from transposon gypsy, partial [Mucuna pruriens]
MREANKWKVAFNTKFSLYEWLVMPFGLTNTPSMFMRLMNHVLRSLIGNCVVIYFDDIFVYSACVDDYIVHVRNMLQLLNDESLYVNLEKYIFYTNEVIFLRYLVGLQGVRVDKEKVKAIQCWSTSTKVSDVRSYHSLASFYTCFVKDFSTVSTPLNEIIKKDDRLSNALILALTNFHKSFKLECDMSNGQCYYKKGTDSTYFIPFTRSLDSEKPKLIIPHMTRSSTL